MKKAIEHYERGELDEAISAMNDEVRSDPTDHARRSFLCELLCFARNFERADKQLEIMLNQLPDDAPGVAVLRQLVRAELDRQEFFSQGRVPEFLAEPDEALQRYLRASIAIREGDAVAAATLLAEAEEARSPRAGTCDGERIDDFRDLDDLTAGVVETLTSTGKYYWVPVSRIRSMTFHPPERPFDLIWRRTMMDVEDGPEGEVYVPTRYAPGPDEDDAARLVRRTDWIGSDGEAVRGVGQRMFLCGAEPRPILEIGSITLDESGEG